MFRRVFVNGYRSLRELCFDTGPLTVVTGGNGVGKSNVYRAIGLLSAAATGSLARHIVGEGGMESVLWAGTPDGGKPRRVQVGVATDAGCYELELGLPQQGPFKLDPEVKLEWLWDSVPRRPRSVWLRREARAATALDAEGRSRSYEQLDASESVLAQVDEPKQLGDAWQLRRALMGIRLYHGFRTDPESPLRVGQVGTFTPRLASDGSDLAAAIETVLHVGDRDALLDAVRRAVGGDLGIAEEASRLHVELALPGLRRPLHAREMSDGTLKLLALLAALYAPRPGPLAVFNEPEASLHPDVLVPLADELALASRRTSVWVLSHSRALVERLLRAGAVHLELMRDGQGATRIVGQTLLTRPEWP